MHTIFFDLEDRDNPANAMELTSGDQVAALLDKLRYRNAFMCELECENDMTLTIGLNEYFGCVRYAYSDNVPPFWLAVGDGSVTENQVFRCNGQSVEIDSAYCLPYNVVKSIAIHFVETGKQSELVEWTDI